MVANEALPVTICTDSWTVYQGLTLWISTWYANKWMVMHRPLWGARLWQDLQELGHQKQITIYHVTRHAPLPSPGDEEADMLAKVQWLETVPASPSRIEITLWLYHCLLHAGEKTMWSTIKIWGHTCYLNRGTGRL